MKHTNSLLWGSVSILIGIVISILALVRGVWQVPLLITAFAVWGLYLIFILLIPLLRSNRELRRRERRAERPPCRKTYRLEDRYQIRFGNESYRRRRTAESCG